MIAMAMVCRTKLLIADEPTTALDVTIQAQILSLMSGLKKEFDMSVLLITHDLGVIAQVAQRVMVMYAGQVVEQASVTDLFNHPFHPYTRGLLESIPKMGSRGQAKKVRLAEIPGTVPPLTETIIGCKFARRCRHAFARCREERPEVSSVSGDHEVRCWLKQHPEKRS
jgi:peptide/nickel transport system ATP-binding protein